MNQTEHAAMVSRLYARYSSELHRLQRPAGALMRRLQSMHKVAASDDLEIEMTYMLVREEKPRRVLELAPAGGFSSFYLLSALVANAQEPPHHSESAGGRLFSYDIRPALAVAAVEDALGSLYPGNGSLLRRAFHAYEVGDARRSLPQRMADATGQPFFEYGVRAHTRTQYTHARARCAECALLAL
jgi:hypothetical protein